MLPAQQRLGADQPAAPKVHHRLIVKDELICLHAFVDTCQVIVATARVPILNGIEDQIAVLARLLGPIHHLVGVTKQRVDIAVVEGEDGHADTG